VPRLLHFLRLSLWPPARRAPNWRAALPLFVAIFSFVFILGLLLHFSSLRFSRPAALLLFALCPWFWQLSRASSLQLSPHRATASLFARLSLLAIFAILFAEPQSVRSSSDLSAIFVLDISDSVSQDATGNSIEYLLRAAQGKPPADEVGLVVFGREPAVELPPQSSLPFEAINAQVARDGTDIASALSLAAALIPEDRPGRLVLVSDGQKTEGDTTSAIAQLQARNIPVDVLPIEFSIEQEVWLERLDVPHQIKLGETYQATTILSATSPGTGSLILLEDGEEVYREQVDYKSGKNRFSLPLSLRQPGYYEYTARIEVPQGADGWRENNIAMASAFVEGEGRILLVTNPDGDARDWQPLAAALRAGELLVDVQTAFGYPRDPLALMPYDAITLVNCPAELFDPAQMLATQTAVNRQGIGLLMVGGAESFGPGGYHNTPIEEILPVSMDVSQKKFIPKAALGIILHTCEFAQGNTWGKRIAKEAIRVLNSQDIASVYAFNWGQGDVRVVPPTRAGDFEPIALAINQAELGDMPSFVPTLQLALQDLSESDAAMRHLIIISDGDPSPPPPALIQQFVNAQISITSVVINPHGGLDISNMQAISSATGGRYYFPQDASSLPSIFIKEAKTMKRDMIQNVTFFPEPSFPSPVLKGIEALPQLHGYVLSTPKPQAQIILTAPQGDEQDVEPVLAIWRHGTATTAAFTSDFGLNWGRDWTTSPSYQPFVQQLFEEISRVRTPSDLSLRLTHTSAEGIALLEDAAPGAPPLSVQAQVVGPDNRQEALEFEQVAPGRYRATFPLWGRGRYHVAVSSQDEDRQDQAIAGLAVPYSLEYLHFGSDLSALRQIAQSTKGRLLGGSSEEAANLLKVDRDPRLSSRPALDWFFLALALLIPIDVAIRRLQLDANWLAALFRGRANTETTSILLARRRAVTTSHDRPIQRSSPTPPRPPEGRPSNPSSSLDPAKHDTPAPSENASTAAQLLARRRQQQGPQDPSNHKN